MRLSDTLLVIKKNIRSAQCVVMFDIDETILSCVERWQEYTSAEMGVDLSIEQIARAGSVGNYFRTTPRHSEFTKIADRLRASKKFNSGLPIVVGSRTAFHQISIIPNLTIGGYLTSRPSDVLGITENNLRINGFPPLPILARPSDVSYGLSVHWKLDVLNSIKENFDGILIMIDDSLELARAIQRRNTMTESFIVSILYNAPLTQLQIQWEKADIHSVNHCFVAHWKDIPPICSRYATSSTSLYLQQS